MDFCGFPPFETLVYRHQANNFSGRFLKSSQTTERNQKTEVPPIHLQETIQSLWSNPKLIFIPGLHSIYRASQQCFRWKVSSSDQCPHTLDQFQCILLLPGGHLDLTGIWMLCALLSNFDVPMLRIRNVILGDYKTKLSHKSTSSILSYSFNKLPCWRFVLFGVILLAGGSLDD